MILTLDGACGVDSDSRKRLVTRLVAAVGVALLVGGFGTAAAAEPVAESGPPAMTAEDLQSFRPILGLKRERTTAEGKLDARLLFAWRAASRAKSLGPALAPVPAFVRTFAAENVGADGMTFVVIRAPVTAGIVAALGSLGARDIGEFARFETLTATLPLDALPGIAARSDVRHVGPRERFHANSRLPVAGEPVPRTRSTSLVPKAGAASWEGLSAHEALKAHASGITGAGAKVCVLSDGVDSAAARIASGDLPASMQVLAGQAGSGDEGTAMLEVVHDMSPGAALHFATASPSVAQFATNIEALRSTFACDVIVDDITYLNEGVFQDGPIAQAVNAVTASGALFFSSAGNDGNFSDGTSGTYEGDFVASASAVPPAIAAGYGAAVELHSFGANPYTTLTAPTAAVTLKWSDPLGGSGNDYDLAVMDATGTSILGTPGINVQSGTQDPYELAICVACTFPAGSRIYVVRSSGQARALSLRVYEGALADGTTGSTAGHNAAAAALTVGQVDVGTAAGGPFVGGAANPVRSTSSDGPRKIFYDPDGSAITPGNLLFGTGGGTTLAKVDLAAAACGTTTTPGYGTFCGTSAAAPTAAAIAALVKSANPTATKGQVTSALLDSALDIEAAGFDRDSGVGIVMAPAAVRAVLAPMTVTKSFVPPVIAPGGTSVLTIAVSNANSVALQGAAFVDAYPVPMVNAAIPDATISGTGCTASSTAIAGSGSLAISSATIPAATTCTFRVSVTNAAAGVYSDASGALGTPMELDSAGASAALSVGVAPDAPTGVGATAGTGQVVVSFTPPVNDGGLAITSFTASCSPVAGGGATTGTAASSPITVSGLLSATEYSCTVSATNVAGTGPSSAPSGGVTTAKASQVVSFNSTAPTQATVGGASYSPSASASSGLTVSLSIDASASAVCSLLGASVSFSAVGSCVINADQAGNSTYSAAPRVQQSFAVGKGTQAIAFPAVVPPPLVPGGTFAVSATASSGLVVTLATTTPAVCTVSGNTVTLVAAGICTVTANQPGSADYFAAPQVTQDISLQLATFTLTVSRSGAGTGTVTSSPPGINCGLACAASLDAGTSVTLTATPSAGSILAGWSGGGCSGTAACTLVLGATTTVTASFVLATSIPRLVNISTRLQVRTGNDVMIGGFVIGGGTPKTVVVRARGPSLAAFGIANALANPNLDLYSGQAVIASNDDFGNAANLADLQSSGFAPGHPMESAILATLDPGAYTAIVTGVGGTTGVAIVEVFEVDRPEALLANISTRGQVLTNDDVMIGGFIVQGDSPQTVVVRARGPSLAGFGIANALGNPVLQLYSGQALIAGNDDWGDAANAAQVTASGFAPGSALESAILITLQPGAYTAIVTGAAGATGVGIVEVFAR